MSFHYDLTQLKNREQLIDFLGLNKEMFESTLTFDPSLKKISEPSINGIKTISIPLFFMHAIPKKNIRRGHRIVWEITYLKNEYKTLARRLSSFFSYKLKNFPHDRAFGFIGGRNIRENARDHCGHKNLLCVDLKNFFPSIQATRIADFFKSIGMTTDVSDSLSQFVTIGGSLPLGFPTSPIISNAICLPMDEDLETLARKHQATFSRYADDISFSSNGPLPPLENITRCIRQHGFELAEEKTRASKIGQAHYVTGLSVSDSLQPHVPRLKKRRLRQEIYYAEKYGLDDHLHHIGINDPRIIQQQINRLDGLVKFIAHHEPKLASHLKPTWTKVLQVSGNSPSFEPKNQSRAPFYIYIDEAEYIQPNGIKLLALAMSVSQHQEEITQATQKILEATLSDLWAAGNRDAILKKGMHFADATEDLRLIYVDRMRSLPFQGYVAMAQLPSAADYEATYLRLLAAMTKRRLMAAESQFAHFVFEENDKVRRSLIYETVMSAFDSLKSSNNRHPEFCEISYEGKPSLDISVPDFLLGVLGKYFKTKPEAEGKPTSRDVLLFERIRDKYRLILDLDNSIEYSRRRPITPWQ